MSKTLTRLSLILAVALIVFATGCAGTAKRNAALYESQLKAHGDITESRERLDQEAFAQRIAEATALANKCTTDDCVSDISRDNLLREAIVQLGKRAGADMAANLPAPPYERDGWAKVGGFVTAVAPIVGQGIQAVQAIKAFESQERVSINRDNRTADIALGGINANATTAQAAVANAGPRYSAGGDIVLGNNQNGDTTSINGQGNATNGSQIGDNVEGEAIATHGGQIGDTTSIVGNENAVDGVIDNSVLSGTQVSGSSNVATENGEGDQRIESPGPINDENCTGESCNNPPPEDPADPPGTP